MIETNNIRVGVIGCGFFSSNHLNSWREIPTVELAAVCDRNVGRAEELCSKLGLQVPIFTDAAAMMQSGYVDFVDIVTQPATHRDLVMLAAASNMPAIVQKPMDSSYEVAKTMVDAMAAARLPFMVHENFRFQAPIEAVGEIVRSGRIGRPMYARIAFRCGYDVVAGQPYLATEQRFVIADLGVHVLDVARFLLGDALRVKAEVNTVREGLVAEDSASMLLRHEGGAISVVECSYSSFLPDDPFPQTLITVEGTGGAVVLGPNYELTWRDADGQHVRNVEPSAPGWAERPWHVVQDSVLRVNRHWVDCFARGVEPSTSGRDNLKTIELVEAAYASLDAAGPTAD